MSHGTLSTQAGAPPDSLNVYVRGLLDGGFKWNTALTGHGPEIHYFFATDGTAPWNSNETQSIASAFGDWAEVANVKFVASTTIDDAEIVFHRTNDAFLLNAFGGFAGTPYAASAENTTVKIYSKNGKTSKDLLIGDYGRVHVYYPADDGNFGAGWGGETVGFQTVLHEIGHALGLKHPHDTGASGLGPKFPNVATNNLNNHLYTLMSYNSPPSSFGGVPTEPMALDIAAIQWLYGANTTYQSTGSTYELPEPQTKAGMRGFGWGCLWDTGGIDTISYSGSNVARIDLRPATLDGGAGTGGYLSYTMNANNGNIGRGFSIAGDITNALADVNGVTGVIIENASGGSGDDRINGNDVDNHLSGNAGVDVIHGHGGIDTIEGGGAKDTLYGDTGDDVIHGGFGKDRIEGGDNNDTIYGDADHDTLIGGKGNDTYYLYDVDFWEYDKIIEKNGEGVDTVHVSQDDAVYTYVLPDFVENGYIDWPATGYQLKGNSLRNELYGNIGRDVLHGMGNDDFLNGGGGADFLYGDGGKDTFKDQSGYDELRGGTGDDTYFLDDINNEIGFPFTWDKVIEAKNEGTDIVYVAFFSGGPSQYQMTDNVEIGAITTQYLSSSGISQTLKGNALPNYLWGNIGDDTLVGFGGADHLDGGWGQDKLYGDVGDDIYTLYLNPATNDYDTVYESEGSEWGYDTVNITGAYGTTYYMYAFVEEVHITNGAGFRFVGSDSDNKIFGSSDGEKIEGGGGADILDGGAGHDYLYGGAGDDIYILKDVAFWDGFWSYDLVSDNNEFSPADPGSENDRVEIYAVTVQTDGGPLTINSFDLGASYIENVTVMTKTVGFTVTGNDLDNALFGNFSQDYLYGLGGNDRLLGSRATDHLDGGADDDELVGGTGKDFLTGGTGKDTFRYQVLDDSTVGASRDVIEDFNQSEHDIIDVQGIDAKTGVSGNQTFTFIGDAGFHGTKGELHYRIIGPEEGNATLVEGDTDGDGHADFQIELTGVRFLTVDDFAL